MLSLLNRLETDCDWALLHQATLYRLDARGRISAGSSGPQAPDFHLVRTRHGNLWRLHRRLSSSSCRILARLAAREAPLAAGSLTSCPPPERMESMLNVFRADDVEVSLERGPLYRFPEEGLARTSHDSDGFTLTVGSPGSVESVEGLRALFEPHVVAFDSRWPVVVARVDGQIASACFGEPSACETGVEARVETRPGYRLRGLARACTMAWARAVWEAGALPLARTRWEDRSGRALAQSLGLEIYGDSILFGL